MLATQEFGRRRSRWCFIQRLSAKMCLCFALTHMLARMASVRALRASIALSKKESYASFRRPFSSSPLNVHTIREADLVEMMLGGERYSLVPMPESMKATTLFVGNLCEFVQDDDLSKLFCQVSSLNSVPSCVVRKPDTQSMRYGFVSFLSVQEKEVRDGTCRQTGVIDVDEVAATLLYGVLMDPLLRRNLLLLRSRPLFCGFMTLSGAARGSR